MIDARRPDGDRWSWLPEPGWQALFCFVLSTMVLRAVHPVGDARGQRSSTRPGPAAAAESHHDLT
jgi:hypothetical protein